MSDNRRIVYTRPDGGVSVVIPAPGVPDDVLRKAIPADAADVRECTADEIPTDRTFRDAWCGCPVHKVRVDVDKAKQVCHGKRRAARAAEFAPLDVEATIPAKAPQAETKRQGVRDKYAVMQAAIDAATTVDELRAAAAEVL